MSITGLSHIGIYTRDMDKSIVFYANVLGFVEIWNGIVDHPTGKIHAAMLKLGDCIIELVVPVDLNRVNNTAGPLQHLALKVDSLEKTIEKLEAKGIDFSKEKLEFLTTFYTGIKHAFLYGPSGERIELVENLNQ
jgi:catechol 2,3-dioxygenase-like lactoylglutathione lyase family enzyme